MNLQRSSHMNKPFGFVQALLLFAFAIFAIALIFGTAARAIADARASASKPTDNWGTVSLAVNHTEPFRITKLNTKAVIFFLPEGVQVAIENRSGVMYDSAQKGYLSVWLEPNTDEGHFILRLVRTSTGAYTAEIPYAVVRP